MRLKTDAEILRYVRSVSVEKNVRLSPTVCAIFVSMLHLYVRDAEYDEKRGAYFVQYSCRDFSNLLQFSFKMVCVALQKLDDCGLIERVPVKREFRKLKGGSVSVNKPNVTYLDLSLFVEE